MTDPSKYRLGFLTSSDPHDRGAWSGTQHFMFRALQREFAEVVPMGPVSILPGARFGKAADRVSRMLSGRGINHRHNSWNGRAYGRRFNRMLEEGSCDLVFAPAGGVEIAYLETRLPVCYLSDTSYGQISEYYPKYSRQWPAALRGGNAIEQRALTRADAVVYSSKWAADYVLEHYEVDPAKVTVLPFGANLESAPDRSDVLPREVPGTWRLLLLGVSWERKGGAIVLEALERLLGQGHDVELVVCGCVPPVSHPRMRVIPFLDKNDPRQYAELLELIRSSHLLVVPTRAEAFGIVFCEASAYAVPSVVTATGGTTTAVEDGVNGLTLPYEAGGDEFAAAIASLVRDPGRYLALCTSSRDRYERELNWGSWARRMRAIMEAAAAR